MNEPLENRGYKVYQSGYHLQEGGPDISIFQVARDPGIPVKYLGSIVMVLGVITMFYFKRFSSTKPIFAEKTPGAAADSQPVKPFNGGDLLPRTYFNPVSRT